jgi:hypothetical protein
MHHRQLQISSVRMRREERVTIGTKGSRSSEVVTLQIAMTNPKGTILG